MMESHLITLTSMLKHGECKSFVNVAEDLRFDIVGVIIIIDNLQRLSGRFEFLQRIKFKEVEGIQRYCR